MAMMRMDENNNPMAFTTDIAAEAGLTLGADYVHGTPFPAPSTLVTALLIGDPVALTIRVIDAIGWYTREGAQRWTYMAMPNFIWSSLTLTLKAAVIGFGYRREGGTMMRDLFPYGEV